MLNVAELERWPELVAGHAVWGRVDGDAAALRSQAVRLVGHCAELRRAGIEPLRTDPWMDLEFAERVSTRLGDLVAALPEGATMSGAEAALLGAAPFLLDTFWAQQTQRHAALRPWELAEQVGAGGERAAFERFVQGFPRLRRRVAAVPAAAMPLGWWMLHRWLSRLPASYDPQLFARLVAPGLDGAAAGGPYDPGRLAELARALRSDAGYLARNHRQQSLSASVEVQMPGSGGSETIRERLVGYLLTVATALAAETTMLPDVVVEHLGIADPVHLDQLRTTVSQARWRTEGTVLALEAACTHPAVEVALGAHADRVGALLAECHRASADDAATAVLGALPRATTVRLHAVETGTGPAYHSAGVRFRLAEDRVQELLMGEQLYGKPELAVRELYQNALDACRHREARVAYVHRCTGVEEDWSGRIQFRQGVDEDGRRYLDCLDNGVGMGIRELSDVFAQAGIRTADLPEFIEEQAAWAALEPPIRMFPNSRFGIGVLSYFMIADEIAVRSCRYDRDGTPGRSLAVTIAGPGSLFRIRDLGPGDEPGTRLRLYLRPDIGAFSVVEVLREVLWVADFDTDAEDEAARQEWPAGELASSAIATLAADWDDEDEDEDEEFDDEEFDDEDSDTPGWDGDDEDSDTPGWDGDDPDRDESGGREPVLHPRREALSWQDDQDDDPADYDAGIEDAAARFPVVAAPGSRVWWCLGEGQILADGLIAGTTHFGAVINLDRELAPRLSVDRTRILGYSDDDVERLLHAAAPAAADPSGPIGVSWLLRLSDSLPRLADEIFDAAMRQGHTRWPGVAARMRGKDDAGSGKNRVVDVTYLGCFPKSVDGELSTSVAEWRLTARAVSGEFRESLTPTAAWRQVARARPTDRLMLSTDLDGSVPWLHPRDRVPLVHLARASAKLGYAPLEVAARLERLGYDVAPGASRLRRDEGDLVITSRDLDGSRPFLDRDEPVSALHLLRCAQATDRGVHAVAERLEELGFLIGAEVERLTGITIDEVDRVAASVDLDGSAPWLDPVASVPRGHLVRAAVRTKRSPAEIARRLETLGYLTSPVGESLRVEAGDLTLLSRDLDGVGPWLDPTEIVTVPWLLRAAQVTGRPLAALADRMGILGFLITADLEALESVRLGRDDLVLASVDLDAKQPWLDAALPVNPAHLAAAALATGRSIAEVTDRLGELGYRVPQTALDEDELREDLRLISVGGSGRRPWLSPDEPCGPLHIAAIAPTVHRRPSEVAQRLVQLGYATGVDDPAVLDGIDHDDLIVASRDLDAARPWLELDVPVGTVHLLRAAQHLRCQVAEVAARLTRLGYTLAADPGELDSLRLTHSDLIAVSRDLDAAAPWLDGSTEVPVTHLFRVAARNRWTLAKTVNRLAALGLPVSDPARRLPRLRPGGAR